MRVADFCRENMLDYYEMVEVLKQEKLETESYEEQVQCGDLVITEIPESNESSQPKPSTEGYAFLFIGQEMGKKGTEGYGFHLPDGKFWS